MRSNNIRIWDDTHIDLGQNIRDEQNKALENSQVAILLVTPNYLASKDIIEEELPALLKAAKQNGLIIFWIPISFSLAEDTEISTFQPAHDPLNPIDSLPEDQQNKAFHRICNKLKKILADEFLPNNSKEFGAEPMPNYIKYSIVVTMLIISIICMFIYYKRSDIDYDGLKYVSAIQYPNSNGSMSGTISLIFMYSTKKYDIDIDKNKKIKELKYIIIKKYNLEDSIRLRENNFLGFIEWTLFKNGDSIQNENNIIGLSNFVNKDMIEIHYKFVMGSGVVYYNTALPPQDMNEKAPLYALLSLRFNKNDNITSVPNYFNSLQVASVDSSVYFSSRFDKGVNTVDAFKIKNNGNTNKNYGIVEEHQPTIIRRRRKNLLRS